MRTITIIFHILSSLCSCMWVGTVPIKGATINYTFEYCKDDLSVSTVNDSLGQTFDRIEIVGLDNVTLQSGQPAMPREFKFFRLPSEAENISVRILSLGECTTIPLRYPLCSMADTQSGYHDETTNNAMRVDTVFMEKAQSPIVEVADDFFLNGKEHYVNISVSPLCYNRYENTIKFYSSIGVELSYSVSNTKKCLSYPQSEYMPKMFHFDEYVHDITLAEPRRVSSDSQVESLPATYLILVPDNLKEAVSRLGEWKQQKGYNVIIQTVEGILSNPLFSIGSSTKCFDKESSVREWLKEIYRIHGAFYCLIVGDFRTTAPIRKFKRTSTNLSDPNDNYYLPTDAYFSDLVTEWKFARDSSGLYSTYYGTSSFSPTVSVGRLLASENEEVENFTDKIILYELYPGLGNSSYLTRGFIGRHVDSVKSNSDNKNLFSHLKGFQLTQIDGTTAEKLADVSPGSQEVLDCLKEVGLATLQYHGSPVTLRLGDALNDWPKSHFIMALKDYRHINNDAFLGDAYNSMDYIGNQHAPSVMYSLACTLAPFDNVFEENHPGLSNVSAKSHTLAGIFTIAKDFGGPVFLANTREGYFSSSASMEREFGKYIGEGCNVGEAENLSKIMTSDRHIRLVHSIIGDPELMIWTTNPQFINSDVRFDDKSIHIGTLSLTNANIGITAGVFHQRKKYKAVNGSLSVSLNDISAGDTNGGLASVHLSQSEIWPETFLFPLSDKVVKITKSFDVNRFIIGNKETFSNCPVLRLGEGSDVRIFSFTDISSSAGIEVYKDGTLSLEANNMITLEGETVQNGGRLKLTAQRIEISKGCVIGKGGILTVTNRKE